MAGQTMRDIKRRIRSVKSTQQITRAMEMVAAAKLRRAQQQLTTGRPYIAKLRSVLARVLQHGNIREDIRRLHPLLAEGEGRRPLYVVVTADRGLAGGYNANVVRLANATMEEDSREKLIMCIGRKGRDHYVRRGVELYAGGLDSDYVYIGDELTIDEARSVTRLLTDAFTQGVADEVIFVHTVFRGTASHELTVTRLLPIETEDLVVEGDQAEASEGEGVEEKTPIYEPSAAQVVSTLIPRYIETQVYSILLEAKASEQSARMIAMRNATDNAEEMIEQLTLSFNRARQDSITTELSEIVGGANALAGGE